MSKATYTECPNLPSGEPHAYVFLAGGISSCPPWQDKMVELLSDLDIEIINPRRREWPEDDEEAEKEQIEWEHEQLRQADLILFWFPKETLCPITLYELGAWSMTDVPIVIGMHPEYARRFDVETQTRLVRPEINFAYGLEALALKVKEWVLNGEQK